jgi:hypothetical protein
MLTIIRGGERSSEQYYGMKVGYPAVGSISRRQAARYLRAIKADSVPALLQSQEDSTLFVDYSPGAMLTDLADSDLFLFDLAESFQVARRRA